MNHLGYVLMNPEHEDFLTFSLDTQGIVYYAYAPTPDKAKVFLHLDKVEEFMQEHELFLQICKLSEDGNMLHVDHNVTMT